MDELGPLLPWLDLAGLAVFAVSGVLVAVKKRVDFVGACFCAAVTAVGGGTLRDVFIGAPVFWMQDASPVILCIVISLLAWLVPVHWWHERALEWFDAAGIAAYAVYGSSKALQYGVTPISAVTAGVITACVGGVIRDITVGLPSILMRNELYVTAAILAGSLYVGLHVSGVPAPWPAAIGAGAGFALRGAAIRWNLKLPSHRGT